MRRPGVVGHALRHKVLSAVLALTLVLVAVWAARLSQLRHEIDSYRRYWSVPRGEPGGIVYVALGDSTAQGIGADDPEHGYVGLLARQLRETTGRPVQVINLSRSGARVGDVVADQLPRLAGLHADLVTVAVGGNDIGHYEEARFRADVDALVAGLPPETVVADVPWFMHGALGRKSDEAAALVAAVAQAHDLPVARLYRSMRDRGWASMITDFAADWFHPNDRGHKVWADAFWREVSTGDLGRSLGIPVAGR